MNIAQRKHVKERLHAILANKTRELSTRFSTKRENVRKTVTHKLYPTDVEIMLKLAGFESPAVMAFEGKELENNIRSLGRHNIQYYAKPINYEEVERVQKHNAEIDARLRDEVSIPVGNLNEHYHRCVDTLMLSKDDEFILSEIAAFDALVV